MAKHKGSNPAFNPKKIARDIFSIVRNEIGRLLLRVGLPWDISVIGGSMKIGV